MRKVIEEKMYNTATATAVHQWDNGRYSSDFRYYCETLYRTPAGSFFLYCEGGPSSCMSVPVGNNGRGGSEDIVPLQEIDTISWLEQKNAVDTLLKLFPDHVVVA